MPITDIECPKCGTPLHSDDLWFGEETFCNLGCGEEVSETVKQKL
jgi:uncharacterized Zn finger protein (UPF0148 family)